MRGPTMAKPLLAGVLAASMLTACTRTEAPPQKPAPSAPPASANPTPEPPPSTPAPASTVPVIATADGDIPGTKVEINELKRTGGDTLTLKFSIVNGGAKALDFGYSFVEQGKDIPDFNSVGGVHLIDPVGRKKYFVVRDTENQPSCSKGLKDLAPGGRVNLWAKFPAPPEDVQKIAVIVPHFGPLDDIPIGK